MVADDGGVAASGVGDGRAGAILRCARVRTCIFFVCSGCWRRSRLSNEFFVVLRRSNVDRLSLVMAVQGVAATQRAEGWTLSCVMRAAAVLEGARTKNPVCALCFAGAGFMAVHTAAAVCVALSRRAGVIITKSRGVKGGRNKAC